LAQLADEMPEVRHHLGCAPGQVHGANVGVRQPPKNPIDGLAHDDLPALRARVHMTMSAGEVAELAQIKLQDIGALAMARQIVIGQSPSENLTE
jgi:hypothetical protein